MASGYSVNEKYDVHIFNCQKQSCQAAIKGLQEAVSSRCTSIAEYKPFGLKKDWFLAHLNSSSFTIIHECDQADDILACISQDKAEKVMCVKFQTETTACPTGNGIQYKDFVISDLSTADSVEAFVSFVHTCLSDKVSPSHADNNYVTPNAIRKRKEKGTSLVYVNEVNNTYYDLAAVNHTTYAAAQEALDKKDLISPIEEVPGRRLFQPIPTLFGECGGETAALIVAQEKEHYEALVNAVKEHRSELVETIDTFCSDDGCMNARFIVHQMLPCIYKKCKSGSSDCIISLSNFALCKHPEIQKWALTLLELFCLDNTSAFNNVHHLRMVQNSLIHLADKLSNSPQADLEEENCVQLVNKVCNLLLLLQANIIMACYNEIYSSTVHEGPHLVEIICLSSNAQGKKTKTVIRLQKVSELLRAANRKELDKFYQKFKVNFQERKTYPDPKKLLEVESNIQVLVLVECLKQMFCTKDRDLTNLSFMREYLRLGTKKNLLRRRPSKICQELVLRGLAHFLFYSIEKNTDIKAQCEGAIKIIGSLWQLNTINVDPIVARLLFESVPVIRQEILDLYIKKGLYPARLPFYLISEVEQQLSPCLFVDKKNKDQYSEQGGWLFFHGKFSNESAYVMIHRPNDIAHRNRNLSNMNTQEDSMHFNQLNQLRHLQHPHIVAVLAYKTRRIPQFYILQSIGNNLQMELQNRRENEQPYDVTSLLRLLIQTVSAVEYCHERRLIHRNLTAASLSAIAGAQHRTLLGSFKLAHTLKQGSETAEIENDCNWLATRWAAPESLRSHTFSKASDIWMLGILIYEVLTHGVLPYSDLTHDQDLVIKFFPQLNGGQFPNLLPDSFLSARSQMIVKTCCYYEPKDRTSLSQLKRQLEEELAEEMTNQHHDQLRFPNIGPQWKPSTMSSKGLPYIGADVLRKSYENVQVTFKREISAGLKLFETDKQYVFREELVKVVSKSFMTKIHGGVLEPLVPALFIEGSEIYSASTYSCHLPKSGLIESLFAVCKFKKLGNAFANYLDLLQQWTETLRAIHDKQFGLADFCADSLWVQRCAGKYQVYPVSLAYLWQRENLTDNHSVIGKPIEPTVRNRCAPELLNGGKVFEESAVFALGVLIWQVLHAFFQKEYTAAEANVPQAAAAKPEENMNTQFSSKFPDCPNKIVDLLCSCVSPEPHQRPKWSEIVIKLKSNIKELKGSTCVLTPAVVNPSITSGSSTADTLDKSFGRTSMSARSRDTQLVGSTNLTLANPSDGSETSYSTDSSNQGLEFFHRYRRSDRSLQGANQSQDEFGIYSENSQDVESNSSETCFTVGFVTSPDLDKRILGMEPVQVLPGISEYEMFFDDLSKSGKESWPVNKIEGRRCGDMEYFTVTDREDLKKVVGRSSKSCPSKLARTSADDLTNIEYEVCSEFQSPHVSKVTLSDGKDFLNTAKSILANSACYENNENEEEYGSDIYKASNNSADGEENLYMSLPLTIPTFEGPLSSDENETVIENQIYSFPNVYLKETDVCKTTDTRVGGMYEGGYNGSSHKKSEHSAAPPPLLRRFTMPNLPVDAAASSLVNISSSRSDLALCPPAPSPPPLPPRLPVPLFPSPPPLPPRPSIPLKPFLPLLSEDIYEAPDIHLWTDTEDEYIFEFADQENKFSKVIRHINDPLPSLPAELQTSQGQRTSSSFEISTSKYVKKPLEPDYWSVLSGRNTCVTTENPYASILSLPAEDSGTPYTSIESNTVVKEPVHEDKINSDVDQDSNSFLPPESLLDSYSLANSNIPTNLSSLSETEEVNEAISNYSQQELAPDSSRKVEVSEKIFTSETSIPKSSGET